MGKPAQVVARTIGCEMWWGCAKSECTRIAAELSCDVTGPARAVSAQPAAGSTDMGEPAQVVARVIGRERRVRRLKWVAGSTAARARGRSMSRAAAAAAYSMI